jgi:hypothetical protein
MFDQLSAEIIPSLIKVCNRVWSCLINAISDGAVASSKVFDVHLYTRANITFKIGGALFKQEY